MKQLQELIRQGELAAATECAVALLRDDPANADVRANYIELLCLQGVLEKADQQLDILVRQHPDFLVGAVNLRQLIRAAVARQDFAEGGMTATLFGEPDAMFEAMLALRLALKEQDLSQAALAAEQLEQQRPRSQMQVNGTAVNELRDLDDSLGGYLELFGTDGKYYLAKFSEVDSLQLKKPQSLLDTVWRRAEIIIKDGPAGEVFVPMTYQGSVRMTERMGRDTQWQELQPQLVTGQGLKMLLCGDEAISFAELQQLSTAELAASV
ncbi:MAG: virulence protein SciE type [Gammaproteobacteria bacterium]|nr:virulence protein SciE type [Gammaproteobacteria bacterium]MBU1554424.1 virulence protein SciE type [Gammaproteobacteria bacterium]MBU2069552.1 virulence protein SciE type [Gammaproteobacteria bacterium]MBU2183098.1 virulence protein SciE type [Gammaproteobacteria bacterium]MBU2206118.1 virulence protein SciE type [Gammaproteobacteria bacterium]